MKRFNDKMITLANCLKLYNVNVDLICDSNKKFIKYVVFYNKNMKWVGFVESSWTLPVFKGQKGQLDLISFSFGFFDENMKQYYFLSLIDYTKKDIQEIITLLDNQIDKKICINQPRGKTIKKYYYWRKKNGLVLNKLNLN